MNYEESVGLFVGITDRAKHCHPVTFSLSSNEDHESFESALHVVKQYNEGFVPSKALADAAEAFPNACKNVWKKEIEESSSPLHSKGLQRKMCYSHVDKVKKK